MRKGGIRARYQQGFPQKERSLATWNYFREVYENILKPLFFRLSPERAHYLAMDLLVVASMVPGVGWWMRRKAAKRNAGRAVTVAGLTFPNPVGLAAGFDKDARWLPALEMLGFGFVEIGTVTPRAQSGNPQPRLFRLKEDRGILNRMGFNNEGLHFLRWAVLFDAPRGWWWAATLARTKSPPTTGLRRIIWRVWTRCMPT